MSNKVMKDDTGQAINSTLQSLVGAVRPTASDIPYDANTTVKGKIDELNDNKVEGAYSMLMGTFNSTQTLTITASIAFVFFFGTVTQIGILGCRSNNILEIITPGTSISYTVSGTTYNFTNSNTSTAVRYLIIYRN